MYINYKLTRTVMPTWASPRNLRGAVGMAEALISYHPDDLVGNKLRTLFR